MHPNSGWKFFLGVLSIAVLAYTLPTAWQWWRFLRLDTAVPAEDVTWSITMQKRDRFAPAAHFSYTVRGESYRGFRVLDQFSSKHLAEVESLGPILWQRSWTAWIQRGRPLPVLFDKVFPWKRTLYTFILWVLLIYFYSLGYYVRRR